MPITLAYLALCHFMHSSLRQLWGWEHTATSLILSTALHGSLVAPDEFAALAWKNITQTISWELLFVILKGFCCPCAPAEARRWIFLIWGREILQEIRREFSGFLSTHKWRLKNFRGKFRSIFREKFRASKKIFRANFVLQTCHPKILCALINRSPGKKDFARNHASLASHKSQSYIHRCVFKSQSAKSQVLLQKLQNIARNGKGKSITWKGPKGIPGKGIGKNTLKTPWKHPEKSWKILKLPENTWKYPENTPKTPWKILNFMTFSTFSLCPLWVCPLHLSKSHDVIEGRETLSKVL